MGTIPIDLDGNTPGGLGALVFGGTGGMNGSPNTLFFTDGINGETDGLFGAIDPVPLPTALPLFATGLGGLGLLGWRRKRKSRARAWPNSPAKPPALPERIEAVLQLRE